MAHRTSAPVSQHRARFALARATSQGWSLAHLRHILGEEFPGSDCPGNASLLTEAHCARLEALGPCPYEYGLLAGFSDRREVYLAAPWVRQRFRVLRVLSLHYGGDALLLHRSGIVAVAGPPGTTALICAEWEEWEETCARMLRSIGRECVSAADTARARRQYLRDCELQIGATRAPSRSNCPSTPPVDIPHHRRSGSARAPQAPTISGQESATQPREGSEHRYSGALQSYDVIPGWSGAPWAA